MRDVLKRRGKGTVRVWVGEEGAKKDLEADKIAKKSLDGARSDLICKKS